jgi:DoxX-like protein
MKARTCIGWLVTGLMAALMLLSAVPDVLRIPDALVVFRHLGYPPYLLPFLGTAKILGVAAVLIPWVSRLKEWAFAGLTFDLTGALYSHLSVGDPPGAWMPAAIGLLLMAASYLAYRTTPGRPDSSRDRRSYAEGTATTGAPVGLSA